MSIRVNLLNMSEDMEYLVNASKVFSSQKIFSGGYFFTMDISSGSDCVTIFFENEQEIRNFAYNVNVKAEQALLQGCLQDYREEAKEDPCETSGSVLR